MTDFSRKNIKYNSFGGYHPVVIMSYFTIILATTMTVTAPNILITSFICAFIYSGMLGGRKTIKSNLIITLVVILLTTLINTLFTHDGETVLFYLNVNRITLEAIVYGIFSGLMVSTVIVWFSCVNLIITGEMLMYTLGKISPSLGLMISMILRYIPLLKYRFSEISMAQKAIGKEAASGAISRLRLFTKKISILLSWSLEGSIEGADAMAARGYGMRGRSSFVVYKISWRDKVVGMAVGIATVLMIFLSVKAKSTMHFYPRLVVPGITGELIMITLAFAAIAITPMIIDVVGDIRWKKLELRD